MVTFRELRCFPNGDVPEFTFFSDFDIAAHYGEYGIKDTYERVIKYWGSSYKAITEVTICLNLLCWDYYENGNMEISEIFSKYFYKCKEWFYKNYKGNEEALNHFFRMTD